MSIRLPWNERPLSLFFATSKSKWYSIISTGIVPKGTIVTNRLEIAQKYGPVLIGSLFIERKNIEPVLKDGNTYEIFFKLVEDLPYVVNNGDRRRKGSNYNHFFLLTK